MVTSCFFLTKKWVLQKKYIKLKESTAVLVKIQLFKFCAFKKKESQSIDASFIPKSSSVKPLGQFFLSQFKVPDLEITPQHAMQQAVDLADRGDFEKAKNLCEKILRQDSANAEAIFLMGVLQHATGNLDSAEAAFKKTIYLEPNHYDALIYLALLAERKEAFEEAQLFRNRAMRVIVN